MMNKRGQGGLSMNTIVVAIIAIIILLLLVTFFTGGLSTIGQRITDVFKTGTSGYDLDLAVKNCQDYCERAKNLPSGSVANSALCKQTFKIDINRDGVAGDDEVYACVSGVQGIARTVPGVSCPVAC